jgi:outer membrane protein assembly factor BamB/ABC-type phosphate/phosphonate transport system substrate-binding protein
MRFNGQALTGRARTGLAFAVGALALATNLGVPGPAPGDSHAPLPLIVLDPLARELSCACVKGHGQRDYHKLAAWLSARAGRTVRVSFFDNAADALAERSPESPLLMVASASEVASAAAQTGVRLHALCRLTDADGATTLTGLFVVRQDDPARTPADLRGRRLLFSPASAVETREAALAALNAANAAPRQVETAPAAADAALDVLDSREQPPPAAVISSYALPLLEGCGNLGKGELKIVGRTVPVPFVTVFASEGVPLPERERLRAALLSARKNSQLLRALESRDGFVPIVEEADGTSGNEWPDWRGLSRDGHGAPLPEPGAGPPRCVWSRPVLSGGLAGLAVAHGCGVIADRDPADERDVFRCVDAATGALRWLVEYPAPGRLDYGQGPRATPVIRDGRVFLLGAFGDLRCVRLSDGRVLWKKHLVRDLGGVLPQWGASATPLLVDDLLIVNPGGPEASLVALDARTGRLRWKTPGPPAAYSSFIVATLGGRRQLIGLDAESLGGWDVNTGRRLWKIEPPLSGDFNVPTPVVVHDKLLVATENNGARLYAFGADGCVLPQAVATNADLAPVTATPVVAGARVFGNSRGLVCLDATRGLQTVWRLEDPAFEEHASLITDGKSVLAVGLNGECVLFPVDGDQCVIRSRFRLFEDGEVWSHPAWAGGRLYVRGPDRVYCFDFSRP